MTLGIGLYAPCLILISLLGMNPTAAFPIMMGSCAFLMPFASARFVRTPTCYDPKAIIGMLIAGIPAVLIAAFIVKSAAALLGAVARGRRRGVHGAQPAASGAEGALAGGSVDGGAAGVAVGAPGLAVSTPCLRKTVLTSILSIVLPRGAVPETAWHSNPPICCRERWAF